MLRATFGPFFTELSSKHRWRDVAVADRRIYKQQAARTRDAVLTRV